MKFFIFLMSSLLLSSCTSYVRTLGTRMMSPETHGGLGHGTLEARLQASKRDKLNFEDDTVDNAVERAGTTYSLSAFGSVGLFERMDVFLLPALFVGTTTIGTQYQLLGESKAKAKKGNFSLALHAAYGHDSEKDVEDDDLDDFFNGNVRDLEFETSLYDLGLISGYRWSSNFLQYVNAIYVEQKLEGKVTTDTGVLSGTPFEYQHFGMIYSTGFIHYFAKAHWKLDFSHLISDWTKTGKRSVNTINAAIGFDW